MVHTVGKTWIKKRCIMRMLKKVKESNFFWNDDNDHSSSLDDLGSSLYEDEIKALDK